MSPRFFGLALVCALSTVACFAQTGRLVEDFERFSDWRANNQTQLQLSPQYVKSGKSSLMLSGVQGQWMGAQRIFDGGIDLSSMRSLEFWVFVQSSNPSFNGSFVPFAISLSSRTDYASSFINAPPTTNLHVGWNKVTLSRSDFVQAKSTLESWDKRMVGLKFWFAPIPNGRITAFIDKVTVNSGRPVVIFSFDDSLASTYTRAFPILQAQGLPGVSYIISNLVGQKGYMTAPQITELFNAGWDIGNHTQTHTFLEQNDYNLAYRELKNCNDFIVRNGWVRDGSNLHFCCPGGRFNAGLLQALKDLRYKTARTSIGGMQPQEVDDFHMLRSFYVGSLQAQPATTIDFINRTVMANGCVILMFHDITAGAPDRDPSNSEDAFRQIVQHVANLRKQGVLEVMTINQWYESVKGSSAQPSIMPY